MKQAEEQMADKKSYNNNFYDKKTVNSQLFGHSSDYESRNLAKSILDDPTLYDYDSYYDQIQQKRKEIEQQRKIKTNDSKYLDQIKKAMNSRKREEIVVQERLAEKQMKQDKDKFQEKERFITQSYLKQAEENKKFIQQDLEKEKYNEQNSIFNKNKQDTSDFMRNIYNTSDYRIDIQSEILKDKINNEQNNQSNDQDKYHSKKDLDNKNYDKYDRYEKHHKDQKHDRHERHEKHDRHNKHDRHDKHDKQDKHNKQDRHNKHDRHDRHERDDRNERDDKCEKLDRHENKQHQKSRSISKEYVSKADKIRQQKIEEARQRLEQRKQQQQIQ